MKTIERILKSAPVDACHDTIIYAIRNVIFVPLNGLQLRSSNVMPMP